MPDYPRANVVPRHPLDLADLQRAVSSGGSMWTRIELVDSLGSSNTVLGQRASEGTAAHGHVIVAEEQTAGRGRRDRGWVAPKYSSAMLSLLVEPDVDRARWGWLPLVTALAVSDAVAECAAVDAGIKWPNDVVLGESKVAGILSEVVPTPRGQAVVVGLGINVDQSPAELPRTDSTSLRLAGSDVDRGDLVAACLRAWARWYDDWAGSEGDSAAVAASYEQRSTTIGRSVEVHLPDGEVLSGLADRVDGDGHLVVQVGGREHVVVAADVVHLRPSAGRGLSR